MRIFEGYQPDIAGVLTIYSSPDQYHITQISVMKKLILLIVLALSMSFEDACAAYGVARSVDFDKIRVWGGEGSSRAAFVVQWNSTTFGPENLVFGVRWDGRRNIREALADISAEYARIDFDIRQDELLGGDRLVTVSFDVDGNGVFDAKDQSASENNASLWKLYECTGGEALSRTLNPDVTISDGSVYCLSYQSEENTFLPLEWCFYCPENKDENALYLPEEIETTHCGEMYLVIPFIANRSAADVKLSNMNVATSLGTKTMCTILQKYADKSLVRQMKPKNGPWESTVEISADFISGAETAVVKSNTCLLKRNPAIYIESIRFEPSEIEMSPDSRMALPLHIEPACPSMKGMSYTSKQHFAWVDNGVIRSSASEGRDTIIAVYRENKEITDTLVVNVRLKNKAVDFTLGVDEIVIPYKEVFGVRPVFFPADVDIRKVKVEVDDPSVVSEFGGNVYEYPLLVAHRAGRTKVTVTTTDGSEISHTYDVVVKEPECAITDFTDGTIMLNEEWFGHTNGSLNYIGPDYEMVYRPYEAVNDGNNFGCTSQFAINFAGKLFVSSKQAADGGDPNPGGGRLVVADARTLKTICSFDDINGGDGRDMVGVSPDKIYIGTNKGLQALDLNSMTIGPKILEVQNADEEFGPMVYIGGRVFAMQLKVGLHVLDATTDNLISTIKADDIASVVLSSSGKVWMATSKKLVCINPATLEVERELDVRGISGGTMRPSSMFAQPDADILWWKIGSTYYRWSTDSDISDAESFNFLQGQQGAQSLYGAVRYDARSGELIVPALRGFGYGALENWIHYYDADSRTIVRTLRPRNYFWFQSMPVFPDKYEPEILLGDIELSLSDNFEITSGRLVADRDANQNKASIEVSLIKAPDASVADASICDGHLTVTPLAQGHTELALRAVSNGRVAEKTVAIDVRGTSGIGEVGHEAVVVTGSRGFIGFRGLDKDARVEVFDYAGICIRSFRAEMPDYSLAVAPGFYIVRIGAIRTVRVYVR